MKICKILYLIYFLGTELNAQSYYNGEFTIRKIETYYGSNFTSKNYVVYSNLYADSVNRNETWHSDNLGNVYFNSTGLLYNSVIKTYMDTIQRQSNVGMQWIVTSSSGPITSFTATCLDTFSTIQNIDFFPDTLKKSDSLYIYFGEVTNADEIELTMFDGRLRILFPFNRKVSSSSHSISVPSSDLTTLGGDVVNLTLSLIKYEYQIHNGKRFKFEKRYNIVKTLRLVN